MSEIFITEENFEEEVMKSELPVLIDFWADWCGPCKMLSPVISEIAEKYEGKIKVGKVNVDEHPVLSDAFHISSIPFLAVMKNGKLVASSIGYKPIEDIEELLWE